MYLIVHDENCDAYLIVQDDGSETLKMVCHAMSEDHAKRIKMAMNQHLLREFG